jgi:RimJ/RimL family protein N-acetyltransferase
MLPEQIDAQRIHLRRPILADATTIFQSYAQDAAVCRFLIWQPHKSESVTHDFIASCIEAWNAGSRRPYVVAEQGSAAAIGMIEARIQGPTVDMGYVLARPHWGKGIMSEAIEALVKKALALPYFFRAQAFCDTENFQSQRALEKAGLRREGRLERWLVHPNISPEPRACFMYATVK